MIKRLYLAGPMSGIPQLNFPRFHEEAARLRALGYEVVNPAELNNEDPNAVFSSKAEKEDHWRKCMRVDIKHLLTCDSVALLEGWTASRGARLEQHVALELGMAPRLASFFVRPPVLESTLQEIA
jgi:nucleoside 2-deoxyribosyltransferase